MKNKVPTKKKTQQNTSARVLIFDIETAPLEGFVWGLWENNLGLNQIKEDWTILSWSAKWLGDPPSKVMYQDQRNVKNVRDDKKLLQGIWDLLNQADVVITQNGKSFDVKKLNARFVIHGFKPPSSYRHLDTKVIAKKSFAFTSHGLEYMSEKLCTKYKKLKHKSFPGFSLWTECLKGNKAAWKEMERYNKHDVLATEELYQKIMAWDSSINFDVYHDKNSQVCACGSSKFKLNGFAYTSAGKFQRFVCLDCGRESRSKVNLLSKEKKQSLRR